MKTITIHMEDDVYSDWGRAIMSRNVMGFVSPADAVNQLILDAMMAGKEKVTIRAKKAKAKKKGKKG